MPGLIRQARQVVDQYVGYSGYPGSDSQPAESTAFEAPHADPDPDHVDYGAYTGQYGAHGWYTDHPVLLEPGHQ